MIALCDGCRPGVPSPAAPFDLDELGGVGLEHTQEVMRHTVNVNLPSQSCTGIAAVEQRFNRLVNFQGVVSANGHKR